MKGAGFLGIPPPPAVAATPALMGTARCNQDWKLSVVRRGERVNTHSAAPAAMPSPGPLFVQENECIIDAK